MIKVYQDNKNVKIEVKEDFVTVVWTYYDCILCRNIDGVVGILNNQDCFMPFSIDNKLIRG